MLRWATIGSNFISDHFLTAAADQPDFVLRGVYSRSTERGEAFAERYGAQKSYTTLEQIASDPEVDAVYIASPNVCHREQTLLMLAADKHVLVEKPAAVTAADFEEMLQLARDRNRILLEGMRPLFTPGIAKVKELLPQLGTIRHATLSYCQYSSRYDAFRAGEVKNAFNPELGNSALLDLGIYGIAVMLWLFGRPREISCRELQLPNGFMGAGTLLAQYDQMLGEIIYSKLSDSQLSSEIQGEEGSLLIDAISNPQRLTLRLRGEQAQVIDTATGNFGMQAELAAFTAMTAGRQSAEPYNRNTWDALRLADMARQ